MSELTGWGDFYLIVGSAAGALIGLQFVVMTIIAERLPVRAADAGAAFATPTIIHFGAALCLSALLTAPWPSITLAAMLWGLLGMLGLLYEVIVARRIRKQTAYPPVFEDWLFHVHLPLAAYAVLIVTSFMAPSHIAEALAGVGVAALLLLFIGIHNAWDAATHHIFVVRRRTQEESETGAGTMAALASKKRK